MIYVEVVFKTPLTQSFSYQSSFSDSLFKRVLVSFGHKKQIGFVISQSKTSQFKQTNKLKSLLNLLDEKPLISKKDLELAQWISRYYSASLGEALSLFFSFSSSKVIKRKKKIVDQQEKKQTLSLTEKQNQIAIQILKNTTTFNISLIHGITGSGKTHIYIDLIEKTIARNKQVILLIPEIGLTSQIEDVLTSFFHQETIAIIHAQISSEKKRQIYQEVLEEKIKIIIGPRSAVFAPTVNLGLIIVDEEHEATYKNSQVPRYHARQVAQYKCRQHQVPLVLGSATPSVEIFYQTRQKKINYYSLDTRYQGVPLPQSQVMSSKKGSQTVINRDILKMLYANLEKGYQSILYINYRGYAPSLFCKQCGFFWRCYRCDVSLSYHKARDRLLCHQCGYEKKNINMQTCERCKQGPLSTIGIGTERLVEEIVEKIDKAKVLRFDSDKLSTPKKIKEHLKDFVRHKYNIIVGTQMIIKGHDFPDVQLVVVIYPERYLAFPDFRSNERVFSQITQVSGRAGRRSLKGNVVVLTDLADHYAIKYGCEQDYFAFYEKEIEARKEFAYPPFSKLFRMVLRSKEEKKLIEFSLEIKKKLVDSLSDSAQILGPAPCLLSKIKHHYRWNYLMRIKDLSRFFQGLDQFKHHLKRLPSIYIEYDMDPVELI